MKSESVIVIGGGIAGLTAASLLACEGLDVVLLEAHYQLGGCAGTFKRGKYLFDVGATQVAGLEQGGIHERLFSYLNVSLPKAKLLDPACVVDLADGSQPINIWNDPTKWALEREKHFPGSNRFWKLCYELHQSNWEFNNRGPILPSRSNWDLIQLIKSIRLKNLFSGLLLSASIKDLMYLCNCNNDTRLKRFLDLQLKLYSQENTENTAALYGATVLQISQKPHGLWHINGSMQELSNKLQDSFLRNKGKLLLGHKVTSVKASNKNHPWEINIIDKNNKQSKLKSWDVVSSLPPQSLLGLMKENSGLPSNYRNHIKNLKEPNGAIVFYGAIERKFLSKDLASHIQIATKSFGSLFISISQEGDGRAPLGEATIIASAFTSTAEWISLTQNIYNEKKKNISKEIISILEDWLKIDPSHWLHKELATPKSFAFWTGRPNGIVGGLGQRPSNFGVFGLASRTPMKGLWLCGDSIHPGEGTAGASQSALMACRQIMSSRGRKLSI